MARFGSVITAMVTPFDDDGRLDTAAAADLARWLVDQGSEGLVLAGTTGESPVLTDDEDVALWESVREAVSVPLIAGSGTNDTRHAIELTERATATGVDGVLVVTPYYNRPAQAGIEAHFRSVAGATQLPMLIYDIPVRTGRKVDTETLLRLAHDVPNIVGVKDAAGNPPETARLIAEAPDDFEVYSGDDAYTLPLLSVGAVGLISVASHWSAAQHGEMVAAFQKGDVRTAREINARLVESHRFESSDATPNPLPTKAMMRVLGHHVGQCRPPLGPAPDGLEDRAREVLANLK